MGLNNTYFHFLFSYSRASKMRTIWDQSFQFTIQRLFASRGDKQCIFYWRGSKVFTKQVFREFTTRGSTVDICQCPCSTISQMHELIDQINVLL